jgi:hypothetical protein
MSSGVKNNFDESESMYMIMKVDEPEKVLRMLSEIFGFAQRGLTAKGRKEGIIAEDRYGNKVLLVQRGGTLPISKETTEAVLIYTPDLLKTYFRLQAASYGIKIEQVPKYTEKGLELIFLDRYGNRFILLETRDYQQFE